VNTENLQSYSASDLSQLVSIGKNFIEKFPTGGIFKVHGEMGAGKTTFIKTICELLELPFQGSPTFAIVHEYSNGTPIELIHFDLYRIKNTAELNDIGFEEYIYRKAYVFIEWPQIAQPFLPETTQNVLICDMGSYRQIEF
jgi:tRNA threonylcarbamoyladenosine biosynthesis protein TsaE